MDRFDVIIIGGGSAGLSALKHISTLGKQAILIESGKQIGSKNISGGILYSKNSAYGKVYNVEDIYGENFLKETPFERRITKYILNATSKNKVFSIDLTSVHDYKSNFGYSVLLNKLNSWFAKEASEEAEKQGGGIISGVHVNGISWKDKEVTNSSNSTPSMIVETDELEEFETDAIIAADGVNSEVASMVGARDKFSTEQLYQGVKVVIKLPEEIIEKRFNISPEEGIAHLFSGDISLNQIGGGFLYTNRESLSIGGVYHLDSLLKNPVEPYGLINALLNNPMIKELIKDEVPIKNIARDLPKEEQTKRSYAISKLINTWNELKYIYYSPKNRQKYITDGKFKSIEDIEEKMTSTKNKLIDEYNTKFVTNYIELEYGAKLVPDGKRCMMKKPYYKNILFIGDAAGRGVFIGPRIEGLNVGIDDAARAAQAVARSIDRNNSEPDYMGKIYTNSLGESPYTRDMKKIDKGYVKTLVNTISQTPLHDLGFKNNFILDCMSNEFLRNFGITLINRLGYNRFLSFLESKNTYTDVPILLAEKLGKMISSEYELNIPEIDERISKLKYYEDSSPHILVTKPQIEFMKKMTILCPTKCYSIEDNKVVLQHEGCIECGTCSKETEWKHPKGEKGIFFRYG
ncbi:MAG: electron transfer flavoprotein [Nitrososphaeraceae archaeon]